MGGLIFCSAIQRARFWKRRGGVKSIGLQFPLIAEAL